MKCTSTIAERVADLRALGETPEAARARALEEFGDVAAVRAELVEIDRGAESKRRRAAWWEGVAQDARHVTRRLLNYPEFRSVAAAAPAGVAVAGYVNDRLPLGSGANAPTVRVEYAVGDYFRVLRLGPEGGRFFEGDEQSPAGSLP